MAKWVFYFLVFVYMCYRAVYGARAIDTSISVEQINYGDDGFLEVGTRKTISCRASNRNQRLEWIDPFGDVVKRIPTSRVFAQEHFISSPKGNRSPSLVLTLTNLLATDSGIYQCKSGDQKKSVRICAIKPAVFVDNQVEVTIEAGRAITLSCQAIGDPEPRLVWNRNGYELAEGVESPKFKLNRKYNSQGYESLLTITSVEPEDADLYTCVAEQESPMLDNCTHSDSMNITLRVNSAPKFKNDNDTEMVYGQTNEIVDIKCAAKGWPKPTYRWFKDLGGEALYEFDKSKIVFSDEPNTAVLSVTAGPTTYGSNYKCLASNSFGVTEKYFKLMRREKPWKVDSVWAGFVKSNHIYFNVTWDEEPLFPIDSFEIQYLSSSKIRSKTPEKYDWKKAKQVVEELDEDEEEVVDEVGEGITIKLDDIEPETEYFFRVRAVNEAGEGPWSESVRVYSLSETATEEGVDEPDEDPTAEAEINTDNGMFYGIFFAGGIMIVAVVCMFVMRLV